MKVTVWHWFVAVLLAACLHGAAAYWFLHRPATPQGSKNLGVGGLEVSIAMVAAAMEAPAAPVEPASPPVAAEVSVAEAALEPGPELMPETAPEPEPVADEEMPPLVAPEEVVVAAVPALPKVRPKPRPKQQMAEPPKPVTKPKAAEKAATPAKAAPAPKAVEKDDTPGAYKTKVVSQGRSKSSKQADAADQAAQQGGGLFVGEVQPDYMTKLRHWLEHHKTYPRKAKRRRQQGVVHLAFTLSREGKVLAKRIVGSSGYRALDKETLAMLKRAEPLPQFPKEMTGEYLELELPIQFAIE